MIRIAAAGDLHYDRDSRGKLLPHIESLRESADLLLLAGDLTQTGHIDEAKILAQDLAHCPIPIYATLGNHDYHHDVVPQITGTLENGNIRVLERSSSTFSIGSQTVGIVGLKGFGGGFLGSCGTDFGEPEMKAFVRHTKEEAHVLKSALESLATDFRIVLLHYSPTAETLIGEKKEIYPFLGSYLLAEAIDSAGADIIFHGHAHKGIEKGSTPGGIPVRNVAQPVIRHTFNIYTIGK